VVICHLGVRSWHAAAFLESVGFAASSLAGGIDRWAVDVDPRMPRY
jgi:sulfur-carrier protein adenylyltransferase/sulfurtransferase